MATVAPVTPVDDTPKLSEAEVAYNKAVADLVEVVMEIAADVSLDMKKRQLPEGLKGDKVYGAKSANRSHLNSYASQIKKVAGIVSKLEKGTSKKSKSGFLGFSIPGYIKPVMARALGLKEGSLLWPAGGQPKFSAALITRFFTHRVMAKGLIHENDLAVFSSDDLMLSLFSPFTVSSVKPDEAPIDLQNLTYPGLQKLIKNFVVKRDKANPGPNLNPETDDGKKLIEVFKSLETQFKILGEMKDKVKTAMAAVAVAKEDFVKANTEFNAGNINQDHLNSYGVSFQKCSQETASLYAQYKQAASQMGI